MYSHNDLLIEKQYQATKMAKQLENRHLLRSLNRTGTVDKVLIKLGTLMVNWGTRLQSRCQEFAKGSMQQDASHV